MDVDIAISGGVYFQLNSYKTYVLWTFSKKLEKCPPQLGNN